MVVSQIEFWEKYIFWFWFKKKIMPFLGFVNIWIPYVSFSWDSVLETFHQVQSFSYSTLSNKSIFVSTFFVKNTQISDPSLSYYHISIVSIVISSSTKSHLSSCIEHFSRIHYATLHYTTLLHYTSLYYTTQQYTTLHYTTLHYTTLHYTAEPSHKSVLCNAELSF